MNINVAKHSFKWIRVEEQILYPYRPFITNEAFPSLFTLETIQQNHQPIVQTIADFSDENGRTLIGVNEYGYRFDHFDTDETTPFVSIFSSVDFQKAQLNILDPDQEARATNSALMMLFAFRSSYFDTLLIHSSVIVWQGKGYLFLGKSGTGKSTHSQLWLKHIEGSRLLNDDNPVIRIIDSKPIVFGSPWSGKTSCYINEYYPIGGIVRLQQAPENRLTPLRGAHALAAILPSCSTLPGHPEIQSNTINTINRLAETIPIYSLQCRPDEAAARICHQKIVYSQYAE